MGLSSLRWIRRKGKVSVNAYNVHGVQSSERSCRADYISSRMWPSRMWQSLWPHACSRLAPLVHGNPRQRRTSWTASALDLLPMDAIIGPDNEPISEWDVSRVTDMSELFQFCKNFNGDISGWDTSNATTFKNMFLGATSFNQPLGSWNTEKATDFGYMFEGATAFNQPLGSWNTERVTNFQYMFYRATAFNQPLCSWNTEKATNFRMSHSIPCNCVPQVI